MPPLRGEKTDFELFDPPVVTDASQTVVSSREPGLVIIEQVSLVGE